MATKNQSQISSIDDEPLVQVSPEVMAANAGIVPAENMDDGLSGKMEMVTVHSSSEENGGDAILLIHNGYARQIPRDTPVKIPTEVAQVLRDAKVTQYKPGPGGAVTEEQRPRYAFSAVPV
jgi:hypothetical protein